eukprot:scaffold26220_cov77-Phaeocystis_antarctica.AAC.2
MRAWVRPVHGEDDDGKTSTELVTEAISKGLKQDRTLRAKANANGLPGVNPFHDRGNPFACGGYGPICIGSESFPTVQPPCDEKSKFIMNARRHDAGSFDWDSDDSGALIMEITYVALCSTSPLPSWRTSHPMWLPMDLPLATCRDAFQATRTDDGTVKSEKLYCEQAPGFNVKAKDGAPMVCEILVALQGRVDAARLFGDRLEQIIFKLGGARSTWDPKSIWWKIIPVRVVKNEL